MSPSFDHQLVARQLVRALRGRRSQTSLSRRLGFGTNVVYAWEAGRSSPTITQFLQLAERCGVDTRAALGGFYVKPPAWLGSLREFPSRAGVAAFLRNQRGQVTVVELSERTGISRFALSRWLKGSAEPRLGEFLRVLDHASQRLPEWIARFVSPEALPSIREQWKRQQAARAATYELPWTQAVLRALELRDYVRLRRHDGVWLAERLGVSRSVVDRAIELLDSSGQITWRDEHWRVVSEAALDLRSDPNAARAQRAFWTDVAAQRSKTAKGMFAYNVCGISEADLRRLTRMQRDFLQAARAVIAESQPVERVVLLQTQIFALDGDEPPDPGAGS